VKYTKIFVFISVIFLLNYPVSVSAMKTLSQQEQMFFDMCARGDIAGVSNAVIDGFNINKRDANGRNALLIACEIGNKDLVKYLVEHDANIFAGGRNSESPRDTALKYGHIDIVKYLDDELMLLEVKGARGGQLRSNVTKEQQQEISRKDGAEAKQRALFAQVPSKQKNVMLSSMCLDGDDIPGIARLIESGANVNNKDSSGRSLLYIACVSGDEDLVKCLMEHNANVFNVDQNNSSARDVALRRGYGDIVKYLDGRIASPKNKKINEPKTNVVNSNKPKNQQQQNQAQKNKPQVVQPAIISSPKNVVTQAPKGQQQVNQIQVKQSKNIQENNIKITRTKNVVHIYKYDENPDYYTEFVLFKNCKDCLPAGSYYRASKEIFGVMTDLRIAAPANLKNDNGQPVVKNHLSRLKYMGDTKMKMHMKGDLRHSFPKEVEREAGNWARVIIKNPIEDPDQITNSTKEFMMLATIPGEINEVDNTTGKSIITNQLLGVFEFTVKKSPYEEIGECFHRFFAPKGEVGVEEFGAKAQNKRIGL
jgi:ankyrin repeat protein